MKYDFETLISRKNTGSGKWDGMYKENPDVPDGVVPFSVADMEFKNPPQVAEGISEHLKNSILGYTFATDAYYNAVIGWMKRRHQWDIKKDWIVEYPGVVPALFHLVKLFTEPDEGVILFTPVYYPFYNAVRNGGRTLVETQLKLTEDRYEIDFEDFEEKAKNSKNTLCILSNPHNPVGRVWTEDELARIGKICLDNNVLVISDEIHQDLIMPGYKHKVYATISEEMAQNCVVCTAPSKTFNLAGLMTSNLIIPNPELKEKVYEYRESQAVYFCNIAGYKGCEIAYNDCEDWLEELLTVLEDNRKLLETFITEKFPQIKVIPLEGTYLQWLDCRGLGLHYKELNKFMTEEAFLFTDEGYIFGEPGEGFERINLACPTWVLQEALDRMEKAWKKRVEVLQLT
ncbi:MalY/PatB family protein [uncultured Draconibacterium sp.]|uniref:MalY/PatB family protein n=1 Tax=uncultured Draconibacterium sp. TaxID=1573823 RepID=UPI002AA8006E|nr:MalY/PatB family protein [uncultured Draconibacterium sp.]